MGRCFLDHGVVKGGPEMQESFPIVESSNCQDGASLGVVAIQEMLLAIPKVAEIRHLQHLTKKRVYYSSV